MPRALVVDDEAAIRSILHRFLSRRGWQVAAMLLEKARHSAATLSGS